MATRIHLTSKEGVFQEMEARQHRMTADEPANNHGTDKGPAPYELLWRREGPEGDLLLLRLREGGG